MGLLLETLRQYFLNFLVLGPLYIINCKVPQRIFFNMHYMYLIYCIRTLDKKTLNIYHIS